MQVKALVKGTVQGVGFRPFVYRIASELKLKGYVKNIGRGVELVLDGSKSRISAFFTKLRNSSPPLVTIEDVSSSEGTFGNYNSFKILRSSGVATSVSIPPDVGICDDCLRELYDESNRRHNYWFITCTNCGPRFTMTRELPYDRETTTMSQFKMCSDCEMEYTDPLNRRHHAQTIACHKCGPNLQLVDIHGNELPASDQIKKTAELLNRGKIVAIKGIGGIHLTCLASDDKAIGRLRERRRRPQKPLAIMARDMDTVKSFAMVSATEEKLLKSWRKPIVVLRRSNHYWLSDKLSPGLKTIGVMLPYTGLHYLLLDHTKGPIVMTSANLPDEPTIKDDEQAMAKLANIVDYFLLHNREIYNRCDDSVIRVVQEKLVFLRRSRGYVPEPVEVADAGETILALGAELDNTFCIAKDGKAYPSQYIGDTSNLDTFNGLKESLSKFQGLIGASKFDSIVCDLHPSFNTTRLAKELAEKYGCRLVQVQHHFAHLASCMAEHKLEEATGIVCDGYGYGLDGKAWGGEVITARGNAFNRIGHLEYQPMIGGDVATKKPVRLAVGILSKFMDANEIAGTVAASKDEVRVWLKQLETGFNVVESSSCGRFLDAVSALLGVCYERTYEGEPAIKLENLALSGKEYIELPVKITRENDSYVLETTGIFKALVESLDSPPEDLALSVHHALAVGLARIAEKSKSRNICFTGGVASNELFNRFLAEEITGIKTQTKVPCGDGGISLGQAFSISLDKAHQ
ncbi:MAG: carbamoyltransferase HypF [Candidatus Diapherotrites archaeon]|nr:carbamoyltransferase HypF [Candidatus Diapherotrites archaeon]